MAKTKPKSLAEISAKIKESKDSKDTKEGVKIQPLNEKPEEKKQDDKGMIGHNSALEQDKKTDSMVHRIMHEILKVHEQKKQLADHEKNLKSQLKSNGFPLMAVNDVIRKMKMDPGVLKSHLNDVFHIMDAVKLPDQMGIQLSLGLLNTEDDDEEVNEKGDPIQNFKKVNKK